MTSSHRRVDWLSLAAVLLPLAYFVLTVLLLPRPYYFHVTDLEQGYYFGAQLIHDGNPVLAIDHPGTPIYLLGAGLMALTGAGPDRTQAYFNAGYIAIALVNLIALWVFARLVLRRLPSGPALLSLALAVTHPTWLTYTNTFGADAFVAPLTLATLSVYWLSLEREGSQRTRLWVLTGALAGLSLAVKFTTLPVMLIVIAASWWTALQSRAGWRGLLVLPLTTLLVFLLCVLPTFPRVPQIFINLFLREEGVPAFSWNVLRGNLRAALADPTAALFFLAGVAAGLWALARFARRTFAGRSLRAFWQQADDRAVLVILLTAGFGYLFLSALLRKGAETYLGVPSPYLLDPGVFFRNILPLSLFAPFAVAWLAAEAGARVRNGLWTALAAILLVGSWSGHLDHRQRMIAYERERLAVTAPALRAYALPGTRIAVWDGSPGDVLGPESFQFWGNYAYANDYYDAQLLAYYPDYTFLKLREVYRLIGPPEQGVDPDSLLGRWMRRFPSPYYAPRNNDFVTGEGAGVRVSVLAMPAAEVSIEGITSSDLDAIVRQRFGEYRAVRETIAGVDWLIFLVQPAR